MSFLYPHEIRVKRNAHQEGEGALGYGGTDRQDGQEWVIRDPIACNIQSRSSGRQNPTGLPGDTLAAQWFIYIARRLVPEGLIREGDFVHDHLDRRFKVQAAYPHSMGWRLTCDRMEG